RPVVGDRAPEPVPAGPQLGDEVVLVARLHDRRAVHARAADPLQAQVVRVLAEVRELDDRGARLDREPREREAVLGRRRLLARRPNSDQTWTSTRSETPRASRSRWKASSESAAVWSPLCSAAAWSPCVS